MREDVPNQLQITSRDRDDLSNCYYAINVSLFHCITLILEPENIDTILLPLYRLLKIFEF